MINIEQVEEDIKKLPEEAQLLLIDFIEILKKRYSSPEKQPTPTDQNFSDQPTTLELLQESGLIGCISGESDLSANYKSVLKEGLDSKYDNR
jgi:hypothetical protein